MKKFLILILVITLCFIGYYLYNTHINNNNTKPIEESKTEDALPENNDVATDAPIGSDTIGLIMWEDDYYNTNASDLINQAYTAVTSSKAWKDYCNYSKDKYCTDINKFDLRWESNSGDFIYDYLGDDYFVKVTIEGNEIAVYLTNEEHDTIKNFLPY